MIKKVITQHFFWNAFSQTGTSSAPIVLRKQMIPIQTNKLTVVNRIMIERFNQTLILLDLDKSHKSHFEKVCTPKDIRDLIIDKKSSFTISDSLKGNLFQVAYSK